MPKRQTKLTRRTARHRQDNDPELPRVTGDGPAERWCMTCGATFLSEGWHNRLCRRCAKRSQSLATYAARGVSRTGRGGLN
jgi:hypothetical protein